MNDELETIWKEALVTNSRYYPVIFIEGLRKTKQENARQASRCSGRDWILALPNTNLENYL
jgi:hypothetical protein